MTDPDKKPAKPTKLEGDVLTLENGLPSPHVNHTVAMVNRLTGFEFQFATAADAVQQQLDGVTNAYTKAKVEKEEAHAADLLKLETDFLNEARKLEEQLDQIHNGQAILNAGLDKAKELLSDGQ